MNRTERIGFRITPKEKLAVQQLADIEGGLSVAALLRRLIRKAANEQGVWPPVDTPDQTFLGYEMEVMNIDRKATIVRNRRTRK